MQFTFVRPLNYHVNEENGDYARNYLDRIGKVLVVADHCQDTEQEYVCEIYGNITAVASYQPLQIHFMAFLRTKEDLAFEEEDKT